MAILYDTGETLRRRVGRCLEDDFKHQAIEAAQDAFYGKRKELVDQIPRWEEVRRCAATIRDHVNDELDFYVKQFAVNAEAAGSIVHFAPTADDALCEILDIFEEVDARTCVKAKSMMTEEIGLNEVLESAGITVTETDCAEHIIQTAGDRPSHIVVPALHLDREAIAELYRDKEGYAGSSAPENITHFLRALLRDGFLTADIGIRGCNFAVADTGSVTLVTNEGNGRMVDSIPKTQIVIVGIDRIVPDLASLDVMMSLLVRSAVGAKLTAYFTVDTGPRRQSDADGPENVHIIIVDNGRSGILASEFKPMLRCIRCGACLNTCPVYRHITGHGYGSIYPGPMGIVLTAALEGYDSIDKLPYACTLCGACDEDCPMKIPLHDLIRLHRSKMVEQGYAGPAERLIFAAAGAVLGNRALYDASTKIAAFGMKPLAHGRTGLGRDTAWIPIVGAWTRSRDLDLLSTRRFRDWFARRGSSSPRFVPTGQRGGGRDEA